MEEIKAMDRMAEIKEELQLLSVWYYEGEIPEDIFWRRIELQQERSELLQGFKYGIPSF